MKRFSGYLFWALLLFLSACSIDNTMYNAQKYFASAMERPLSANGRPTPQAVAEYTKTIQKCGIILSEDPDGKQADDALFLMARALYYKKNSAFQAKDAFESLIQGYPDSKYIPEAHIYLARVLRDINQAAEAKALLERFIRDPKYVDHSAEALLVLADFEIQDGDHTKAQYWLERIVNNHKNTKESNEAFFLLGKSYYEQKNYQKSIEEFKNFINIRGINKERRLEARYYIALNYYHLGETESAYRELRYIVRNEQRPGQLSQARVLLGRVLLALGDEEKGLEELEAVTSNYPRTENSAAAYYYLGMYKYYNQGKIEEAIAQFNRVRGEYARSELADKANRISNALNQIKPNRALDITRDTDAWLQNHYRRAEYFLDPLALPDSAIATYQRVISQKDSLLAQISLYQTQIDSLNLRIASMQDSIAHVQETEVETEIPNIDFKQESLTEPPDPEAVPLAESENDLPSLGKEIETENLAPEDGKETLEDIPPTIPEPDLATLEQIRDGIISEQESLGELISRFDAEILPFCYYSIYSIILDDPSYAELNQEVYEILQTQYPRNMYTRAATALKEGRIPRLIDPDYEEALASFDAALELYPPDSDSLVSRMQDFLQVEYDDLRLRANYRLGWHFSFEEPDTTRAKQYLREVLTNSEAGEYATAVRRFFDGEKYILYDSKLNTKFEETDLINGQNPPDQVAEPPEETTQTPKEQQILPSDIPAIPEIELPKPKGEVVAPLENDTEPPENMENPAEDIPSSDNQPQESEDLPHIKE